MASAGKVVAGTAGFAGGTGALGFGVVKIMTMEPDATLLSSLSDFSTKYTTGTFAAYDNNKSLFVDPDNSQKWWEWVFENRFKEPVSDQFKEVKSGFSTFDNTALNNVCKTALKVTKNTLVYVPYKKDIWKYCSKAGVVSNNVSKRPESKQVTSVTGDDKFGKKNSEKFADDSSENTEWWNWVYENVYKPNNKDKNSQSGDLHDDFKNVSKGYGSEEQALNKVCNKVYDKKATEVVEIKYKKNVWKYCSRDGKVPKDVEQPPTQVYVLNANESKTGHTVSNTKGLGSVTANQSLLISKIEQNEEVWNWIFENRLRSDKSNNTKKNNIHNSFNSVTKGYSNTDGDTTSLNQVCKTSYEKEKSDLTSDGEKYKKSIGLYCTKEGKEDSLTLPTED